jgi:hypothetical protein
LLTFGIIFVMLIYAPKKALNVHYYRETKHQTSTGIGLNINNAVSL